MPRFVVKPSRFKLQGTFGSDCSCECGDQDDGGSDVRTCNCIEAICTNCDTCCQTCRSTTLTPPSSDGLESGMNCIKIGLPGKSILRYYFQENRTSRRPFLLLKISFPGRPILIQFVPERRLPTRRPFSTPLTNLRSELDNRVGQQSLSYVSYVSYMSYVP